MDVPLPRVVAYRSLADVTRFAARLDALNLASRRPSPFDTFAYLQNFVAHDEYKKPGEKMLFLVAFDGGDPVGFLPLREIPERLFGVPYTAIRFLMTHDNDRPRAVARPEDEARCCEAFYRHLFEVENRWALLLFDEQDDASPLCRPPASIDLRRHYVRTFPNNPNGTIELPYGSLAEYLHTFNRMHRRKVERGLRRIASVGALEFVSSSDPRALPGLFDLYLDLERRSWKAKVDGHIGRHPEREAFFRKLLEPDQPMEMRIGLLLLDGVPIAGFIGGVFGGGLYGFEIAFDEGYRDISPGNALSILLVQSAIAERLRFLDMLGNYAYYKARWHATITETRAVQIYRKASLVYLKARAGEIRRRLRPPVSPYEVDHNLARKDADPPEEERDAALPDRVAERDRARAVIAAIEQAGARLTRLDARGLERVLPFALRFNGLRPKKLPTTEVRP